MTIAWLLREVRRALEEEGRGDRVEAAESAILAGLPGGAIDEACAALRARAAHRALLRAEEAFRTRERRRANIEAPVALTMAYVGLVFAYGYARALDIARAEALVEAAWRALPPGDDVHTFLLVRFEERVQEALGASPKSAEEVEEEYETIERFLRYKIERLRQQSRILEPREALDAVWFFEAGVARPWRFRPEGRGAIARAIHSAAERLPGAEAEGRLTRAAHWIATGNPLLALERQALVRDLGEALLGAPSALAQEILLATLGQIAVTTDSFNTNSHFCLSVVGLADALVLGLIGEPPFRACDSFRFERRAA